MTSPRFMWLVVAGGGHSSEQRGLTEDLDDAKAKVIARSSYPESPSGNFAPCLAGLKGVANTGC